MPAALAVGERVGASGRDVLTAIVAGYEIGLRVGQAIRPTPETAAVVASWYHWQGFCAVVPAARLLRLSREQCRDALGYTGACSPVPVWVTKYGRPVHWIKNDYGEQARVGVLAALMARGGLRAPRHLLDHDLGLWRMIGSDRYRPEELTRGLGGHWLILDTTVKPYPCCRYIHSTLDALRDLAREHSLQADEIDQVVVRSFGGMTRWFADYRPSTMVDADFSVPYAAALVLSGREPGPAWYDSATLSDPGVLALADRVRLEQDEECDALFWNERRYVTRVEVTTRDGRRLHARPDSPRGGRELPLSEEELTEKFLALARVALPAVRGRHVLTDLLAIDRFGDIRPIVRALATERDRTA